MTINDIMGALGSSVVLPLFIFIFAVILKVKPGTAFKSALFIGIGLIGINMALGFFTTQISGVVNLMAENTKIDLPFLDVGWGAAASVAFSTTIGLMIIPFAIAINIILLLLKVTDTLNIDIWNFWHFALVGGLVVYATGSAWKGFVAAGIMELFCLLLADWSQPASRQYYGYDGISFTTVSSVEYMPYAVIVNKLLDLIGLDKVHWDPATIRKKFRVFGEPAVLGLLIGLFIGIAAHWKQLGAFESWVSILAAAMTTAAIMHIFPLMPRILMQGLMPISNGIRDTFSKMGIKRDINLGMDTALCCGETATLASALLMIPITLVLMVVLPYNKFLWIADLLAFPWFFALITPVTKGNILKNIVIGGTYLLIGNYIITLITPFFTETAIKAGYEVAAGVEGINAGGEGISWLLYGIYKGGLSYIGMLAWFVGYLVLLYFFKKNRMAFYKAAGYSEEAPAVSETATPEYV